MSSEQLNFQFSIPVARRQRLIDPRWSPALREQFSARLRGHFPEQPFRLRFNDNTSTVISVQKRHGLLELSLHHMFIEAPDQVLVALADYLRGSARGDSRLDQFIERNRNRLANPTARRAQASHLPSRSAGKHYDLEVIRDALGRAYLGGAVSVPIQWGRRRHRRRRGGSIRLGSYSFEDGLISIHPALDQAFVPAYVVVGVVYHELLHHVLGAEQRGGRRYVHTPEFRRREREYVLFERAERWERDNLHRLVEQSR